MLWGTLPAGKESAEDGGKAGGKAAVQCEGGCLSRNGPSKYLFLLEHLSLPYIKMSKVLKLHLNDKEPEKCQHNKWIVT